MSTSRWLAEGGRDGSEYDRRFEQLAAGGVDVHGEATFVEGVLGGRAGRVLDAGCGTGRVAIELARRGHDVVGVDVDARMLAAARAKAPELPWVEADLAALDDVDLGPPFDVVVAPGNVMVYVAPGTEGAVLANLAARLRRPDGLLVAGFALDRHLDAPTYDRLSAEAGLVLAERWATWDRRPFDGGDYAVTVSALSTSSSSPTTPVQNGPNSA